MNSSSRTPSVSTKSVDEYLTIYCPKCKSKLSHFYLNEKEVIFLCTSPNVKLFHFSHLSCTNSQVIFTNQGILTECNFPFEEDDISFYICQENNVKEKYFEIFNKFVPKNSKEECIANISLFDTNVDETIEICEAGYDA